MSKRATASHGLVGLGGGSYVPRETMIGISRLWVTGGGGEGRVVGARVQGVVTGTDVAQNQALCRRILARQLIPEVAKFAPGV
jgi:hypothetical protein